jgi:hypothetical protein
MIAEALISYIEMPQIPYIFREKVGSLIFNDTVNVLEIHSKQKSPVGYS